MSEITPFNFEGHDVRVVVIIDEPWWVVNDVCGVLGIADPVRAASRLDGDDLRQAHLTDSLGREQLTNIVNEPGLYELIFRSDKPAAKAFRRWVIAEVLPAIRRTGGYSVEPAPKPDLSQLDVLVAVVTEMRDQQNRVTAIEAKQTDHEARLDAIEGGSGWVAAKGWANVNGLRVTDNATMARFGKRASRIMREMGLPVRKTSHQIWGEVNLYPEGVLARAAEELDLS